MKTIKITKHIYTIGELSREAQEKAWQDWAAEGDYPWASENENSLNAFCALFGVRVRGWSYGDATAGIRGVYISNNQYSDDIRNLRGLRLRVWVINNFWHYLEKPRYLGRIQGRPRYSKCQTEISCPFTGYCVDMDLLDPLIQFINKPNTSDGILDLLRGCCESWLAACQKDFEHYFSFEQFIDHSESNGYEYEQDGTFYRG